MSRDIQNRYERDGFAFPVEITTPEDAKRWRADFERCEASWKDHKDAAAIGGFPHLVFPEIHAMVHNQQVLDAVEQVLGKDILCYNFSTFIKEPQTASFVSWHQDLNYWGLDDVDEVTAWIALSPANENSGCMRFIKGSHLERFEHRDTFAKDNMLTRGQEVEVEIDESDAVSIELEPGQMSLHHGLLMHASGPNSTDDRDYAVLVRGEDRFGHFRLADAPKEAFDPDAVARAIEVQELHEKILYRGADQEQA